jgi:predicted transcriptional regulator
MTKTLTIRIQSLDEALQGFRETFKTLQAGRPVEPRKGVSFTSIEAARRLLTPNRLGLLRAVRTKQPGSIYQLARMLGRDLKNVQQDLRILEQYGLVQMTEGRSAGKRRVKAPRTPFREIALRIAI